MSTSSLVTLTFAPAPGPDGEVADRAALEQLIEAAAGIRALRYDGPLYEQVGLVDDTVRFVVRFDPHPTYGATNLARGLVSRAISQLPAGSLVEIDCTLTGP